jgi:hypothetical protein
MGDWLGTGNVSNRLRQYRPFNEAREFVHGLKLKSLSEWSGYSSSGKRPSDIPSTPAVTYAGKGWIGMGDWLGTDTIAPQLRQYRSFNDARTFVRTLGLKSRSEWSDYCKSGKKPADIPVAVERVYAKEGWAGMGDWLGTGTIASKLRQYRPFNEARAFVHSLGLKSNAEWNRYAKSGQKPHDIPANPNRTYATMGWSGICDWLGTNV